MGPLPGEHPRPAVVPSLGATAMEIRYTQISVFGDYCSLSVQSQRQRPCLENGSRCCCASGLSRSASSIGELRWRAGRFMHSSPASDRKRVFRLPVSSSLPCNRSCPNGKVQLWHLVKVARVVSGEKTKAEGWPQQLKVNMVRSCQRKIPNFLAKSRLRETRGTFVKPSDAK